MLSVAHAKLQAAARDALTVTSFMLLACNVKRSNV